MSRPVKILKGVKQGNVLIFYVIIVTVILRAKSECSPGFSVDLLISNLSYDNDTTDISKSQDDKKKKIRLLVCSRSWFLY